MEDTPMELAAYPLNHRRDAWLQRLLATGASFALFGIGGLILCVLILPLLVLLPGDATVHRRRARSVVHHAFYLHMQFMYRTRVLDFRIEGGERLGQPGQLVVANHPSLIDVIFLISQIRDTNCIVKASLWENPCMHGAVRAAQYISNNGSPEMLEQAADVLREGQTLVIFPEGTRTTPGRAPVFHRGAAAIALRGARTITPVFISVTPTTLTKAEPWYRIPDRRMVVLLRVGDDIDPVQFNDAPLPIASRRLNQYLHQLFLKELDPS
ncbi:lysophospholipid acyltransferase family protein [Rhodanobacter sp. A1T4]|uniref:lysophospholipid acyltransferase family protein n=1 Tax=Rhodanobacter sp. A1T4 TaxID=2723087 RepID=UPI002106F7C5|nr:lysophospholipid acyltransferase family protein [Rhodanobacter sp. A1T4]